MKVFAAIAALLASVSDAASAGEEIHALRDDIRGLCMRLYDVKKHNGKEAKYHCRYVWPSDTQRHVVNQCWKSGWSGQGGLQCQYGVEPFGGQNDAQAGDRSVAKGANWQNADNRVGRRLEIDDEWDMENAAGTDPAAAYEPFEADVSGVVETDVFNLENLEDDEAEIELKGHKFGESLCVLQGMEVIPTEDSNVRSACNVSVGEGKIWKLTHTSARCHVQCTPWY